MRFGTRLPREFAHGDGYKTNHVPHYCRCITFIVVLNVVAVVVGAADDTVGAAVALVLEGSGLRLAASFVAAARVLAGVGPLLAAD